MKMRDSYTCPLELTHDIIRGKWKPIILWQLGKGGASLTDKGRRMLDVVIAMQEIGIELMKEDGKEDFLRQKGLI